MNKDNQTIESAIDHIYTSLTIENCSLVNKGGKKHNLSKETNENRLQKNANYQKSILNLDIEVALTVKSIKAKLNKRPLLTLQE